MFLDYLSVSYDYGKTDSKLMTHWSWLSTENKYYAYAGHHEQKKKKTTGQIKFSAVTIKQRKKLDILYVNKC